MANVFLKKSLTSVSDSITLGSAANVFGDLGGQEEVILMNAPGLTGVMVDQTVEQVTLSGAFSDFTFAKSGATDVLVYKGETLVATIRPQTDDDTAGNGTVLNFSTGPVASTTLNVVSGTDIRIGGAAGQSLTVASASFIPPGVELFSLAAGAAATDEGSTATFTLTTFNVAAGANVAYTLTGVNAADLASGALTGNAVVGADGKATISVALKADTTTEGAETLTVTLDGKAVSATATVNDTSVTVPAVDLTLKPTVDTVVGGTGNDTITGLLDPNTAGNSTLTALDTINGGDGADVLNINVLTAVTELPNVTVSNIETVNIRAAAAVAADVSGFTGLTAVNVTQGVNKLALTAAATTDMNVSGITTGKANTITLNGGKNIVVTDANESNAITIGATKVNAGTITVTDTKQGTGTITTTGGTDVTITATADQTAATSGNIIVGTGTTAPTGAIAITQNLNSDATAALTGGNISTTGGSTVNVAVNAANTSTTLSSNAVQVGTVSVTGTTSTTAVTVAQNLSASSFSTAGTSAVNASSVVTFKLMSAGEETTVNGVTFKANTSLTAAQVATAFANLSGGQYQGAGDTINGIYTNGTPFGSTWSSGAASGATVTFTANAPSLTLTPTLTTAATPAVTSALVQVADAGKVATFGSSTSNPINTGAVTVNGAITGADVLTTVTLDNYATGATVASDALSTLNLANGGSVTITNAASKTLALNVKNINGAINDASGTYTTLNMTATGSNSNVALNAAAATTLTVAGDRAVSLAGSTLDALTTVTVSGSAGLTLDSNVADTLTSVNTAGTTGSVNATIDGTKATYTGGEGSDNVTVNSTGIAKAISLGNGFNYLTLALDSTLPTALISGGTGHDTLVLHTTDAVKHSGTDKFSTQISGFDTLGLSDKSTAASTVDLANLDGISSVNVYGGADALTVKNMANVGQLSMFANTTGTVVMTDAAGAADTLNLSVYNSSTAKVTVAGVETINVNSSGGTLNLVDTSAKTITVAGTSLTLNLDATDLAVTLIDGTNATGSLVASTVKGSVATIKGGSGNDTLTGLNELDQLFGGNGADTFVTKADLVKMTGGAGRDTFDLSQSSAPKDVAAFSTILDFASGDVIKFTNMIPASGVDFVAAQVQLDAVGGFDNMADKAIKTTVDGQVSWFQFGTDTYIVQNGTGSTAVGFENGVDMIVKLTGLYDLGTNASYNASSDTLSLI